jgi:hypothetical protein
MAVVETETSPAQHFHWEPQPAAQTLIKELVADFLERCPRAKELADRMLHETATRFIDWIDHIQAPRTLELRERLLEVGFRHNPDPGASDRYTHPGAMFPQVILVEGPMTRVGIKVDFVADFLAAHMISNDYPIYGDPFSPLRMAPAFRGNNAELWVVERQGYQGFAVPESDAQRTVRAIKALESFRRRERNWPTDEQGFQRVNSLIDAAIANLGPDQTCALFFMAERDYWQRRNRAGQIQYERQNRLGLGWGNHDHHTFRSSRENFPRLIAVLEKLGFRCRERFYAGHEAGWGAQVLEQPNAGITIFADVDLSPDEVAGDFAHEPVLAPRKELGTIGLWVGLHGESMLQAGMHHLECQFDFDALRAQLAAAHVGTMKPFTNMPHLRQAFTEGERWAVSEERIQRLLEAGYITQQQAMNFRMDGAIGSHLENLERNDGFKGFNQQAVSDIIARTDPRKASPTGTPQVIGA